VPGLAALNKGPYARLQSVSCASAGSCSAGGFYAADASGSTQAFVVSERNGRWGTAQEVAASLNTGADAVVDTVSCGSPGNCAAGGQFTGASGHDQAFVISEVNGTWAAARAVAGTLSCCGGAAMTSVSCASAGNCGAGGNDDVGTWVAREKNGAWGKQASLPGVPVQAIQSVSCASAGGCVAGGSYQGTGPGYVLQGFVTQ